MTECPYCKFKGPFLESDRGFSLWPELGKDVRLCPNCQGPFGVGKISLIGKVKAWLNQRKS